MNGGTNETAERVHDALAILLDRELGVLKGLRHRMALLRLALLDGEPAVVQLATGDVMTAADAISEIVAERDAAIAPLLGRNVQIDVDDLAINAPETHAAVLGRLVAERRSELRLIDALRDSTRSIAEEGRRAVDSMLDLTERPDGPRFITGGM